MDTRDHFKNGVSQKRGNPLMLLIVSLFITTNVLGQGKILPYLYLENKNGNILEIPFTDGTITIKEKQILIDIPKEHYQYEYDGIEKFYFKDKSHLTLLNLTVSEGELVPEFNSNIVSYAVDVPYNTTNITITATANNPNVTIAGDGLKELAIGENPFTITVTEEDSETTLDYMVTVNRETETNIISNGNNLDVKIYPNPTSGKFTVHTPDGLFISIYDVEGQKIEDKNISDEYTNFDIKEYSAGVYLLKIIAKFGQSTTKKIVKE